MSACETTTSAQANVNLMRLDFWLRPAKFHFKRTDNPHNRSAVQLGLCLLSEPGEAAGGGDTGIPGRPPLMRDRYK